MPESIHPQPRRAPAPAASEPYRLLAPHYDRILGHFRRPFEALRDRVLQDHRGGLTLPDPSAAEQPTAPAAAPPGDASPLVHVDLGCGTGTGCVQMAWRGWRSYGLDLSPAMIAAAEEKRTRIEHAPPALLAWLSTADHTRLRRLTPARAQTLLRRPLKLQFQVADMRDFTLPEPADFLTCLFDSINHLPRHRDLLPTLRAIRRNLKPGGLALIDANSTQAIREVWPAMKPELHRDDEAGYFTVLQGGPYDRQRKSSTLTWTWFLRRADGHYDRFEEHYPEIAWTAAEWRQTIRKAGLQLRWLKDAARLAHGFDPGWRHALLLTRPAERRGNRTTG